MTKIALTITAGPNGQIIITPPPGVELVVFAGQQGGGDDELLTVAAAAARLGVSAQTMSRYCTAGRVAGARLVGGNWLVPSVGIEELAKQNLRPGRRAKSG